MWLITTRGFYSAVAKREDGDTHVTVRARNKQDLDNLADLLPDCKPYKQKGYTDYEWRLRCTKDQWAETVAILAKEIDYSNFKDEVKRKQGWKRASTYGRVWSVLLDLERPGRFKYSTRGTSKKGTSKGTSGTSAQTDFGFTDFGLEPQPHAAKPKGKQRKAGTRTQPKTGAKR